MQIEVVLVKVSVLACEQCGKEQLLYMSSKEADCSQRTGGGAYRPGHSIHCGWGGDPALINTTSVSAEYRQAE